MKDNDKDERSHGAHFGMMELGSGLDQRHDLYRLARAIQWNLPCDQTELVYFCRRIGEAGVAAILETSVEPHRGAVEAENELIVDAALQEANETYPTVTKRCERLNERLWTLGAQAAASWERSYIRTLSKLRRVAPQRSNRTVKACRNAVLEQRTVRRNFLRQYRGAVPPAQRSPKVQAELRTMERILTHHFSEPVNERDHSLHDPGVRCIAKDKVNKMYEWRRKTAFAADARSTVIVGIASFAHNLYDDETLLTTVATATTHAGKISHNALVDPSYANQTRGGSTEIIQPQGRGEGRRHAYQKTKHRRRMARRSAIVCVIGSLKNDCRMARRDRRGFAGKVLNSYLGTAARNLRKWMRQSTLLPFFATLSATFQTCKTGFPKRRPRPRTHIHIPCAA